MEIQPVVQIAAGSGSDINNQGGEEEEDGQQVLLRCAFIHSIWVDWVFLRSVSFGLKSDEMGCSGMLNPVFPRNALIRFRVCPTTWGTSTVPRAQPAPMIALFPPKFHSSSRMQGPIRRAWTCFQPQTPLLSNGVPHWHW